ncbi:MAG: RNA 2',3'-cyclic phosphodiesterase [Patescibacteria group bacterium]
MNRRIFIAINPPENIRKNLANQQLRWADLPCRWTREENLHITLAFLGYLNDEELVELCKITKEIALRHEPFMISLKKVIYGPDSLRARMVWVEGESSGELAELQKDLEAVLPVEKPRRPKGSGLRSRRMVGSPTSASEPKASEEKESRKYAPHITLGRLKQWEFNKIELEERPQINEDISLTFEANSIDVMESDLKRNGPEYAIIETCQLEN